MATQVRLEAVLDAKDNASSKIKNFDLSLGKLAGGIALGTIAANAFAKATDFVTSAVKDSIQAAKDEEVANAKVNAILETLTGNMQDHVKAVDAAAKSAMKLGFDDEDAAISMAKLLQVTGNATDAQTALANAQDLARFKGIDLEAATQAVSLAMQGNTKILKQLGIDIPETATKMELMGLIHDKVKGQAEAFGKTAEGAQQRFKVALENVQEKIGSAVLPVLTKFFGFLSDVALPKAVQWFEQFTDTIRVITPVLKDSFGATLAEINALIANMNLGLGKSTIQFNAIDVALSPLIGLMQVFNVVLLGITKTLDGLRIAANKVADAIGAVANFTSKTTGSIGDFFNSVNPFRAQGGMISQGAPTIVGERGPELFIPSGSGRVVPNGQLGGSVTVNFNNAVVRSDNDLERLIAEMKKALNEAGRLANTGAL